MIARSKCKSDAYEPTVCLQNRRTGMSQEKGSREYEPSQLATQPTGRGGELGASIPSLSLYSVTTYSLLILFV